MYAPGNEDLLHLFKILPLSTVKTYLQTGETPITSSDELKN